MFGGARAPRHLLASPLTSEVALMPRALFLYFKNMSVRFLVVPRAPPWLMAAAKRPPQLMGCRQCRKQLGREPFISVLMQCFDSITIVWYADS